MSGSDITYLRHMLDAAEKSIDFIADGSRTELDTDEMLALAVVRLLEIVGEASRHISIETKLAYPDVPWQQLSATRNRLIHGYFDVDLDIVWAIVTIDLPPLVSRLEEIIVEIQ